MLVYDLWRARQNCGYWIQGHRSMQSQVYNYLRIMS